MIGDDKQRNSVCRGNPPQKVAKPVNLVDKAGAYVVDGQKQGAVTAVLIKLDHFAS
jgi:hypothetical protein